MRRWKRLGIRHGRRRCQVARKYCLCNTRRDASRYIPIRFELRSPIIYLRVLHRVFAFPQVSVQPLQALALSAQRLRFLGDVSYFRFTEAGTFRGAHETEPAPEEHIHPQSPATAASHKTLAASQHSYASPKVDSHPPSVKDYGLQPPPEGLQQPPTGLQQPPFNGDW